MTTKAQADIRRKLKVLDYVKESGNVSLACRFFAVSRVTYYKWKRDYEARGEPALINSKPCPQNPKLRIAADIEEKILHLRRTYYLGQLRISWYLKRYHDIKVSPAGVWCVLRRNGLNLLPQNRRKRSMEQLNAMRSRFRAIGSRFDVKFLFFTDKAGKRPKRYQYTAIDDASRARALRIYTGHN